jgi:hypothetical protein
MKEQINTGTILIKEGAILPDCLQLESEPYLKGWRLAKNINAEGLDRKIHQAGWTLFFMAKEVDATAVGSDLENTTRRAVNKAIACTKSDRLNCLEIGQVGVKRFLGHYYVSVSAHPRHIQESMFLFRAEYGAESDRVQLAAA